VKVPLPSLSSTDTVFGTPLAIARSTSASVSKLRATTCCGTVPVAAVAAVTVVCVGKAPAPLPNSVLTEVGVELRTVATTSVLASPLRSAASM
jgi:hypothetical protein